MTISVGWLQEAALPPEQWESLGFGASKVREQMDFGVDRKLV
jgi:hypothetical protein